MSEFLIKRLDQPAAFLSEWYMLAANAPDLSFFQSEAWMQAWLEGAPSSAELYLIEMREGGHPLLLGAFSVAARNPPCLGLKEIWFQEFGDRARDAVYAEYLDFLTAPAAPESMRALAVSAMLEHFASADGFIFRNARPALKRAVLTASATRGYQVRVLNEQPVYGCDLSADNFLGGLSSTLRRKIRRAMQLYEERGPLRATLAKSPEEKAAAWETLLRLHSEGWRGRGGGVFGNKKLIAFHDRLRKTAHDAAHLFTVRAGDETIGVLYNFVHGDRVMNYQSGFKFEDDNRMTPGFVAHAMAAQYYQDQGFKIYDLLAGEADYKARLGEQMTTLTSLVVERPTWRNQLRGLIRR